MIDVSRHVGQSPKRFLLNTKAIGAVISLEKDNKFLVNIFIGGGFLPFEFTTEQKRTDFLSELD